MSDFNQIDARKAAEAEQRQADVEARKAPIRDRLVKQYEGIHGEVTDAARLLLDKAAYLELLADEADDVLTQILTYVLTLHTYLGLEIGHEKRIPDSVRKPGFIIHTIFILHSEFSISHFVYSPSCLLRLENAFVSPSSTKPLSVSPI